jgi:hypothetical protein
LSWGGGACCRSERDWRWGVGWEETRLEMDAGEEGLAEVALDDFFGVADGGEVGAGVPLEEEIEIGGELGVEGSGEGDVGEVGS